MRILITGAAGFIGSALAGHLARLGHHVVGIDSLIDSSDPALAEERLHHIEKYPGIEFSRTDICDEHELDKLFREVRPDAVVHLAAKSGVRASLSAPRKFVETNIMGFFNMLECCRHHPVRHFIYASSSSVYGRGRHIPFTEGDSEDAPLNVYAATKKSDELLASVYRSLYAVPATGLRFFTVYGPWGRPDMAPMLFADKILGGLPIELYNHGHMSRDFTYIDDIVEGITVLLQSQMHAESYNLGCGHPVSLLAFVEKLEKALGATADIRLLPMQPGEARDTFASTVAFRRDFGFTPSVSLDDGIVRFAEWHKTYYQNRKK